MSEKAQHVREMVQERFSKVAQEPAGEKKFPVGPEIAKTLGYDTKAIDSLPLSVTESFAGVGNPLPLGEIQAGQTVLDLGCGAGLDSILAARKVGPAGNVIGVDMTEAMVEKARHNVETLQLNNVEFHQTEIDALPIDDNSVDVVVSNGVFNLCPDKPAALAEAHRVLRPGGRLVMADILLEQDVTEEEVARLGTWSD